MTEPINTIISRQILPEDKSEILNEFSLCVEEVVNFGSHLLYWDTEQVKGNEDISITFIIRHALDLFDSISILIKYSSIDPCKVALRGILETFFYLEYLLENNTKERALSFLVCQFHNDLKMYSKFIKNEISNKQFINRLKNDNTIVGEKLPELQNSKVRIKEIQELLKHPIYSQAEQEYKRLTDNGKGNPKWFSFYNGPRTLVELADYLNENLLYETLYRECSGLVHGTDIISKNIVIENHGMVGFRQLRSSKDAQNVTIIAIRLANFIFDLLIKKRIKNKIKEYSDWLLFIKEIEKTAINKK